MLAETDCILAGRYTHKRITPNDRWTRAGYRHICWHVCDPAHIGEHQAQGAPDVGVILKMCRPTHDFYDQHRAEWEAVTEIPESTLASEAAGVALRFVERGGVV